MATDPTVLYLHYLRDMSRKIAQHIGVENIFRSGNGDGDYFRLESDNPATFQNYLRNVHQYLKNHEDRRLFYGAALVIGGLVRNGRRRRVASPLLMTLVELEPDEDDKKILLQKDWNGITLNNDLLTLILDKDQVLEDDEKLDLRQVDLLRDVFQRIEADFERYVLDASIESVVQSKDSLYEVFMKMQVNTPEFHDLAVMPYSKPFQYRERNALLQNPELSVYFENFYFVAPFPHQLSTYIQLNALIKQLSA